MKLNIVVLPGDGIGPEIISVALDVTKAICDKFKHNLSFEYGICGADAIDKVGKSLIQTKLNELCMRSDAVPLVQ